MSALVPFDEAVDIVIAAASALRDSGPPDIRTISIWEGMGFVLAEDIVADRHQPPFDKSMMDGYALRVADVADYALRAADVAEAGASLSVVGEIAAGDTAQRAIGPGEAMAIMTGAPVPDGADAIQIVELCRRDGERVIVERVPERGENIQRAGAHARSGDVVVEKGRVVEALTAGVLGTVGAAHFRVFRRPRVTVVATGNELVGIDETPGPGHIRDSNRRTLMALLDAEWCRVVDGGIIADDKASLRRAIHDGKESEVLVLSGGVSAGAYDLVRECLVAEGCDVLFHQIAIKPGKPVLFGRMGETLVFGLPGNPVSAFVTAVVLLAPALRILGRRPDHKTWYLPLPLVGELPASGKRTTFHPGELVRDGDDRLRVSARAWDGSADHIGYSRSNVLIRRDADAPAARSGDVVRVVLPHAIGSW